MRGMRICITIFRHAETGGIERYLNYLARHLCERGHAVEVLCTAHAEPSHPGVRFVPLRAFGFGKAGRLMAFARAVERHIAAQPYDVVLGLDKTWSQDVIRLGGGLHRTFLEQMHEGQLPLRLRARDRASLEIQQRAFAPGACRRIIVNSKMVQAELMAQYPVAGEAVQVIYNGTDLDRFHPARRETGGRALRNELGVSDTAPVYLFLGNGFARKGLDLALTAFAQLAPRQPQAQLFVVGTDEELSHYQQEAVRLGLGARAHFLGARCEVENCYAAADVFVLPTRYDPFANATVEALASGLPVLTTRSNGGGELVTPGIEGEVFDYREGAERLAGLMHDWASPARLQAGRIAARHRAEQHPIQAKMAEAERLLLQVAEEKSRQNRIP